MMGPSLSGADLTVCDAFVIKSASEESSAGRRLFEQHELLKRRPWPLPSSISTPEAWLYRDSQRVHLIIERVEGPGLILACPDYLEHFGALLDFVEGCFDDSSPAESIDLVRAKIDSLRGSSDWLDAQLARLEALLPSSLVLPFGPCHGDLTLCNALCGCQGHAAGHTVLIDPIDVFVSSPLQDVVKLKQDVVSGWVELHVPEVSHDRILECRRLLYERFPEVLHSRTTQILEALSLLRILPYAHSAVVTSWAKQEAERCLSRSERSFS